MAIKEELTLDTSKAQSSIKALGAQLDGVANGFSKSLANSIKIPKLPPLDVPKINVPAIDAPVIPPPNLDPIRERLAGLATSFKENFSAASQAVANSVKAIGTAAAAASVVAISNFTGFELTLSRIKGLVGATDEQIQSYSAAVLKLAPEVAKSPKELAEALYFITSSGITAKDAMDVLTVSAKAAAAGLGDTQTVADAVTSAVNAYGLANLSAAKATDILVKTVKDGKGEPVELAQSIGFVVPIAANLGVTFDQVGAAMAALTLGGLDASTAATSLRQVLATILDPTKQARDQLDAMGLSAESLRKELREKGLNATLQDLALKTQGNADAEAILFGNIRALTGFLSLTGAGAQRASEIFTDLANSTGATAEAFAAFQQTSSYSLNSLKAFARDAAVVIGGILAPALNAFTSVGGKLLEGFITKAQALPKAFDQEKITAELGHIETALQGLTPAIAGVGVALASTFGSSLPIIGGFLGQIGFVVPILGGLILNSAKAREALAGLFGAFGDVAKSVGPGLLQAFKSVTDSIGSGFATAIERLTPQLAYLVKTASHLAEQVLPLLASTFASVAGPIANIIGAGISVVAHIFELIANNAPLAAAAVVSFGVAVESVKLVNFISGLESIGTVLGGFKFVAGGAASAAAGFIENLSTGNVIAAAATVAIGALTFGYLNHKKAQEELKKNVDNIVVSFRDEKKSIEDVIISAFNAEIAHKKLDDAVTASGISTDAYAQAIRGDGDALQEVRRHLLDSGQVQLTLSDVLKGGSEAWIENGKLVFDNGQEAYHYASGPGTKILDVIREQGRETNLASKATLEGKVASGEITQARLNQILADEKAAGSSETYTSALYRIRDATKDAKQKADDYKSSLDKIFGAPLDAVNSAISYQEALNRVSDSLKQNGTELNLNTDAGLANQEAIASATQTAKDRAKVLADGEGGQEAANQFLQDYTDNLRKQLDPLGKNKDATDAYLRSLGLLDPTLSVANTKLTEYFDTLALTPDQKVTVMNIDANKATDDVLLYLTQLHVADTDIVTYLTLKGVPDAQKELDSFKARKDEVAKKAVIEVDTPTEKSKAQISEIQAKKDALATKAFIPIDAPTGPAIGELVAIQLQKLATAAPASITVSADTSAARLAFAQLQSDLIAIGQNASRAGILAKAQSFYAQGKAIGGPVEAFAPYIVGERGPELFVPQVGGQIVPNEKLKTVPFSPTNYSGGSNRSVVVHAGAFQLNFTGPVNSQTLPTLEKMVDGKFKQLLSDLRSA